MREADGRIYRLRDLTAPAHGAQSGQFAWKGKRPPAGRMWSYTEQRMDRLEADGLIAYTKTGYPRMKRYLDELPDGVLLQDVWTDIDPVNSGAKERRGYPTQKPLALLDRLIRASTNPGDLVLDPFCGCGTAVVSAQGLGRRWIGMDITWLAIAEIQERMQEQFGLRVPIEGSPTEVQGARRLAQQMRNGRHQFELWALTLVGAIPRGGAPKKGADQGVDGVISFTGRSGKLETAIVSVKSGHVQANMVQQLKGAMESHGAALGLFITLEEPTGPMRKEADLAEPYVWDEDGPLRRYPSVQILSIAELLRRGGARPQLPPLLSRPFSCHAVARGRASGTRRARQAEADPGATRAPPVSRTSGGESDPGWGS